MEMGKFIKILRPSFWFMGLPHPLQKPTKPYSTEEAEQSQMYITGDNKIFRPLGFK